MARLVSSRPIRAFAALVAVALVAGGCSKGDDDSVVPAASAGERAGPTTTAPRLVAAPLTGLPVEAEDVDRSAVSIKVDNSPQGRPQAGLDKADVIFEEKVEGGVTRFIAIYHSQDAELVGPIRSLRTSDPAIVSAVGGVFVFSDGVAKSLSRLKGAPVSTVSERDGAGPFTYPKGRKRPLATFGSTDALRQAGKGSDAAPEPLFIFGAPPAGTPATKVTVDYGGLTSAALEWDPSTKRWLRVTNGTAHVLSDGGRLGFTNVVVQRTPYTSAGYKDSSGHKVDEAVVVGSGDALVLVEGMQIKARWSKASPTAPTIYTDATGARIPLREGNTLVMLPPAANAVTVV